MQRWRSDKGFSLVEVMVVVAIIGLMTSAAVLMVPTNDDRLQDMLARTGRLMVAIERQAVMSGQVMGVRFAQDGLALLVMSDNGWVPSDAVLNADASRFAGARLQALTVDGAAVDFMVDGPNGGGHQAHVYFLPTGEKPAFTLTLTQDTRSGMQMGTITVPQMGPFEVKTDG